MTVPQAPMSALVTGGGTGLGRCIAARLVLDGFHVTLMGRRLEPLRKTAAELGEKVSFAVGDVTREADVDNAVAQANAPAPLKLAVLAAGVGGDGAPILRTSLRSWRRVMAVNLDGAFLTLRSCAARIGENGGGSIVAISSAAVSQPHFAMSPYAVSKAALEALVANAANELGSRGVRVNAVRAGVINTDMTAPLYRDDTFSSRQLAETPLGRPGSASDVADAVSFLVSRQASWITGVCLAVDGGNHLRAAIDIGSDRERDQDVLPVERRLST